MCLLSFILSITATSLLWFFAGKTEGAECTSCWSPFFGAHARIRWCINRNLTHQLQVRRRHHITNFACISKNFTKTSSRNQRCIGKRWMELLAKKVYYGSSKRAETRNYKRFLKRNLPNVEMDGGTGWRSTQTRRAHSTTLLHSHNHPYISTM